MRLIMRHDRCRLLHGDAADLAEFVEENSVDAICTDPPAGIGFMSKSWDGDHGGRAQWVAWLAALLRPALRALKPGGFALVWALPRKSHWTALALEDAGFEVRDIHHHIFGTGFPKSLDVSKAIDAMLAGTNQKECAPTRPIVGKVKNPAGTRPSETMGRPNTSGSGFQDAPNVTAAAAEEAVRWTGFGTALKPAVEHWILARKPLDGTYAENVLAHGTGGLNIEACRIGNSKSVPASVSRTANNIYGSGMGSLSAGTAHSGFDPAVGRWPAHLSLEHAEACQEWACVIGCPVREMDEQSGVSQSNGYPADRGQRTHLATYSKPTRRGPPRFGGSFGGASRFFYCAKPSRRERDAGLGHLPAKGGGEATGREEGSVGTANPRAGAGRTGGARNFHPTVKSVDLMRWLLRLITPPGGVVLDLFAGTGSTGLAALAEGCRFVGVELGGDEDEYIPLLEGRLRHALEVAS